MLFNLKRSTQSPSTLFHSTFTLRVKTLLLKRSILACVSYVSWVIYFNRIHKNNPERVCFKENSRGIIATAKKSDRILIAIHNTSRLTRGSSRIIRIFSSCRRGSTIPPSPLPPLEFIIQAGLGFKEGKRNDRIKSDGPISTHTPRASDVNAVQDHSWYRLVSIQRVFVILEGLSYLVWRTKRIVDLNHWFLAVYWLLSVASVFPKGIIVTNTYLLTLWPVLWPISLSTK